MDSRGSVGHTVGVVGGGQLGRMLAEAAAPLGVEIVFLDPTPSAPAAAVASDQLVADFDDAAAIEALARNCDVLTYEIEVADPDALEAAREATGTEVVPSPATLRTIQDKLIQSQTLVDAGLPTPAFKAVDSVEAVRDACAELGYPAMLKARTGGYDGRGNAPVREPDEAASALAAVGGPPAMMERFVDFERELSVIGVIGADERRTFATVENVHEQEILRETIVPARTSNPVRDRAQSVAGDVLEELDGRGVYGIELFETGGGEILVNEVAPRPHNSGHWTIEGAQTSQFEQHLRAVLGLPLGGTATRGPIVTSNLLADVTERVPATPRGIVSVLEASGARLHWYGKREARPLRKMGHVALVGRSDESRDGLLDRARGVTEAVTFEES